MSKKLTPPRITKAGKTKALAYDMWACDHIRHVDGDMYDKPFVQEDWQYKNMWLPIFGTLNSDGSRFYRIAYISIPRTYGKSMWAARAILTLASMEPVYKGEYGFGAGTQPQARIVQDVVGLMIKLNPELASQWEVQKDVFKHKTTEATFKVYPNDWKALQGHHFDGFILDEAHVLKDRKVFDAVMSGQISKPNSLTIIITTAGESRTDYLYRELIPSLRKNPRAFIYWLGFSEADCVDNKPHLKSTWKKLLVTSWHTMADLQFQYDTSPIESFIRYTGNQFPPDSLKSLSAFNSKLRKRIEIDKDAKLWDWQRECVLGIDGAQTGDTFALVYTQWMPDGRIALYPFLFDEAGENGYDLDQIEQLIVERYSTGYVSITAIDPSRLLLMASHLEHKFGLVVTSVKQNDTNMCAASSLLLSYMTESRIVLCGPDADKFLYHLSCVQKVVREPYGWRMSKDRSDKTKLIDGPVAGSMGMLHLENTQRPSESGESLVGWF